MVLGRIQRHGETHTLARRCEQMAGITAMCLDWRAKFMAARHLKTWHTKAIHASIAAFCTMKFHLDHAKANENE